MGKTYEIIVPGDPRGKGRPRFCRGHVIPEKETVKYEKAMKNIWNGRGFGKIHQNGEPVIFFVEAVYKVPKSKPKYFKKECYEGKRFPTGKPDLDNISKMKDGLNGLAWHDDSQVVEEHNLKRYARENEEPHVRFIVKGVESDAER